MKRIVATRSSSADHSAVPKMAHKHSTPDAFHLLHIGLFREERVLQFLNLMKSLGNECFLQLHEVAKNKIGKKADFAAVFCAGLDTIETWNQKVLQTEVEYARKLDGNVELMYKYTVLRYIKEIYDNQEGSTLTMPDFVSFLQAFYVRMANSEEMRRLKFFDLWGIEKEFFFMQAMRGALYDACKGCISAAHGNRDTLSSTDSIDKAVSNLLLDDIAMDISDDESLTPLPGEQSQAAYSPDTLTRFITTPGVTTPASRGTPATRSTPRSVVTPATRSTPRTVVTPRSITTPASRKSLSLMPARHKRTNTVRTPHTVSGTPSRRGSDDQATLDFTDYNDSELISTPRSGRGESGRRVSSSRSRPSTPRTGGPLGAIRVQRSRHPSASRKHSRTPTRKISPFPNTPTQHYNRMMSTSRSGRVNPATERHAEYEARTPDFIDGRAGDSDVPLTPVTVDFIKMMDAANQENKHQRNSQKVIEFDNGPAP